nr:MAG TPA: hypothetical protein [Caudoviricetes sp.]
MTRGRKTTQTEATELTSAADSTVTSVSADTMIDTAAEMGVGFQMVLNYEETLKRIGRIESLNFMATVGDKAIAETFEYFQKTKTYIGLPYMDSAGNFRRVGSFEEFCEVKLGKSYKRCFELAQNLRSLGSELYEQTEKLGLRNKDYRVLRALPPEDQAAIKQAVEETRSREEIIDLIEEMAARHAKEKESLQADLAHAKESAADKDCVIEQKNKKIGELVEQMNHQAALTDAERATEQERALNDAVIETLGGLVVLNQRIAEIRNTGEKTPHGLYIACQGALNRVIEEVIAVSNDWGIAIDPMAGFGAAADVAMPDNTAAGEAAYYDDPNAGEDVGGEDWTAFAR